MFHHWSGQQADKFEESFTKMLKYGALMGDSLDPIPTFQKLGDSCSEILKLLKNVQTEFSIQKNRCEEFPQALSNTSYDFNSELQSIVASGQLLADYDQITGLIANLEELISGPCNIQGLGGSQFGTWNEFLCCFSGGLLHSNFASPLSGHNERIEVELVNEYKYLDQFKQSLENIDVVRSKIAEYAEKKVGQCLACKIPLAGDGLVIAWDLYEQNQINNEIDAALSRSMDGLMLDAYQNSGQVMYWNGNMHVNHLNTDVYMADALMQEFEKNLPTQKDIDAAGLENIIDSTEEKNKKPLEVAGNSSFCEFISGYEDEEKEKIIKALVERDVNSPEYIECYIRWYHYGLGDRYDKEGTSYIDDFEKERP